MIRSACPSCGVVADRDPYDIGSGPELSCSNCEWCWGANGQDLQPITPGVTYEPPPGSFVGTTFTWDQLGHDEGGLPKHLPISINENGQGPTEPDPAYAWVCWCWDPECTLTLALQHAWSAGRRSAEEG
jgi:hypothetical protein